MKSSQSSSKSSGFEASSEATKSSCLPTTRIGSDSLRKVNQKPSASSQRRFAGAPSSSSSKFDAIITCTSALPEKKPSVCPPRIVKSDVCGKKSIASKETSQELRNHEFSAQAKSLRGAEWRQPCQRSYGLPTKPKFVGKCIGNEEDKSGRGEFNKFSITQDPRKAFCLRNPSTKRTEAISPVEECRRIERHVKIAQNIDTPSESASMSSICDEIDLENPMKLDFHGLDRQSTYYNDEKAFQNQKEFRRVKRYVMRRDAKKNVPLQVEAEENEARRRVPEVFDIKHDYDSADEKITLATIHGGDSVVPTPEVLSLPREYNAELCRTDDKSFNQSVLYAEAEIRYGRYKNLYLDRKSKKEELERAQRETQKDQDDLKLVDLADKDFEQFLQRQEQEVAEYKEGVRTEEPKRVFPHTLPETKVFKHAFKKSKRVVRDKARVKTEFYRGLGKLQHLPSARLAISSESSSLPSVSEKSSDDEDDLVVGARGSKYFLRGFHFKLGDNPRGKFHEKTKTGGEGKTKGCMTRLEWFDELAPKPDRTLQSVANPSTVKRDLRPDDPNCELFPVGVVKAPDVVPSAVRDFREKPLGRQYDRVVRKNVRIKHPKTVKVKRFNLTGFMYGRERHQLHESDESLAVVQDAQITDYIRNKEKQQNARLRKKRRQRMRFLGLPCKEQRKERKKEACESSNSESSDWIPELHVDSQRPLTNLRNASCITLGGSTAQLISLFPVKPDYHMPAPEFREPTLRRHPRYPRPYEVLKVESDEILPTLDNTNVPILMKLEEDRYHLENVTEKKTEYMHKFDARQHHDHRDATQEKRLLVKYKPTKPGFAAPVVEKKVQRKKTEIEYFEKAYPQGKDWKEGVDLTLPVLPKTNTKKDTVDPKKCPAKKQVRISRSISGTKDFVYHSQPEGEERKDYPGREKYLQLIRDMRGEFQRQKDDLKDDESELAINKKEYLEELEQDLKSIKSCLSSLEDSVCTNFTNDSGSFLNIQDKKVPLDFIRKSLVPFEEINRSRFKAKPMEPIGDYKNPYQTVPFAGQKQEQLKLVGAKDKFFTFNSRLRNGLRLRLEVPLCDIKEQKLGVKVKATPQVATDLDELYIKDLCNSPPVKIFKRSTAGVTIKEALRKKFESWLIQGKVVEQKIAERIEEMYANEMMMTKLLFDNLFAKWEKKEYETSMAIVHKVKPYYEATDVIKKEAKELEKEYTILNMSIVYIENDWIRLTILQNFHYLLMETSWRDEHDWIHRREDGSLENFKVSIEKRPFVNIRQRDRDDAWAIKEFYDNSYKKEARPVLIVFPSPEEFLKAIERLKSKTFVSILELHYTMWILAELERKFLEFKEWCAVDLASKKKYAENKCEKQYFMERRIEELKTATQEIFEKPLERSVVSSELNQIRGCTAVVFEYVVPPNVRNALKEDADSEQQISMISEVIIDLLGQLESIPVDQQQKIDKAYRKKRMYEARLSAQAVQVEKRIELDMQVVHGNLAPPFQKPKRVGKLPKSGIVRKPRIAKRKPVKISAKTHFFYNAFHDDDEDILQLKDVRESFEIMDTIQESIVPFYFDHFLRLNEYQPNYNFKTQTELRDGPEEKRVKVKSVLPEVMMRLEKWDDMKRRVMEENIKKNPEMYKNVKI